MGIDQLQPTFIFFLFCNENGYLWLIKYQFACLPAMISLLSPVSIPSPALPSPQHTSLTAVTAAPMMPCCVCLHSVISLLTVGMLSVFVSPFSFFMHSTTLRRSSASPANSSMFSPHTLALLSFCILHHYSSSSPSFSFCRHVGLVVWSWNICSLLTFECLPMPPVCILSHLELHARLFQAL